MATKQPKYKPYRQWYFEGYQRQTVTDVNTGRTRTKLMYEGEYYVYNTVNLKMFKLMVAVMLLASISVAVVNMIIKCTYNSNWPGVAVMILFIPMFFLLIPTGYLVLQKPPLTVRQVHSGYFEMSKWLTWGLYFIIAVLIGDIVFAFIYKEPMNWLVEIWHPLLIAANGAINRLWAYIIKKNYPKVVNE